MARLPDNKTVGIRINDMHHGLIQSSGAIIETDFAFLKELGSAIQIATTIKDHEVISDPKSLYAAAGELKIPKALADIALNHLERLGFVRLKYNTGKTKIERIDVTVPGYSKIYHDIGDYFKAENESKIAEDTISILDEVNKFPHKEKDIISQLSVDVKQYELIKDVGKASSIFDTYSSPKDSESIIYSPLYWDENPKSIFELLKKHSSLDLSELIDKIRTHQGIPGDNFRNDLLYDAIKLGCFPTLSVDSTNGLKKFVFTPQLGVGKEEKNLLHKARVLLSCVRYGENFAGITKIYNPERLIEVLSGRGYLKEHSESLKQYESARNYGLVKIIPTSFGRFEVHFIDNEENKKTVDIALQMLQMGEAPKIDDSQDVAKQLLLPNSINHPLQTRIHVLTEKPVERSSTTIEKINDILRGVDV